MLSRGALAQGDRGNAASIIALEPSEGAEPSHAAELGAWTCTLDAEQLFGAGAGTRGAAQLRFRMAPGAELRAGRVERELGLEDAPAWFGRIEGSEFAYILFTRVGEAITGKMLTDDGRLFVFQGDAATGETTVREFNADRLGGCGTKESGAARPPAGAPHERRDPPSPVIVDVLVVYTPSARVQAGSVNAIQAQIAMAIADANVAYQNSLVPMVMHSVGVEEIAYVESNSVQTDVGRLQGTSDGMMDQVHARRDVLGADLVALITTTQDPQFCGYAFIPAYIPFIEPDTRGFSVTTRSCLFANIFVHEIGHNMGCAHDRANGSGGVFSYSYGHRTPINQYRSIMAYPPGISTPYFSNPEITLGGEAMGVPIGQPNESYNTETHRFTAPFVAEFRRAYASPPQEFFLLEPANGVEVSTRRPPFVWSEAPETASYRLRVDDDPAFASPAINVSGLTGTSYVPTSSVLQIGAAYWWRVEATNPLGTTASSPGAASFSTAFVAPASFALVSPADGAASVARSPEFQWTASLNEDSYRVQADNNPGFSSPEIDAQGIIGSSYTHLGAALAPLTQYHWRVIATNLAGATVSSPASRSFTTITAPPASFNLLSPADGAIVPTTRPTLSWSASQFAAGYTVSIDDASDLASPFFTQGVSATSLAVPADVLSSNVRYYWRVSSSNEVGQATASPGIATFAVLVPPCQGDADGDRSVGFPDVIAALASWGTQGPRGDANLDGAVNMLDIVTTLSRWGTVCP